MAADGELRQTEIGESSRLIDEDPRDISIDTMSGWSPMVSGGQIPLDRDPTPERDFGEFTNVHTVTEEMREPLPPHLIFDSEEEDGDMPIQMGSPVRGRVMRSNDDDDDDGDGDEDTEETDDEEPTEYADGMGTTASDIIESLTTRNDELEDQVRHLEEQNQVHQHMEDQYKDVAYQKQAEATELRQTNRELMRQLEGEVTRSDRYRMERDMARTELQAVRGELLREAEIRDIIQEDWLIAASRADNLEEHVRRSTARIDATRFAFDTAMGRLRSRIRSFPQEEGRTRRVISRQVVDHMVKQEYEDAVRRIDQ